VRPESDVRRVFELWERGLSKKAIARETGVSRSQVRAWIRQSIDGVLTSPMRAARAEGGNACAGQCNRPATVDPAAYAYLLGQYLGDGCISPAPRNVFRLRVSMCDVYPNVRDECELAMHMVMPGRRVGRIQRLGCTEVYGDSKHWPCCFPQHGPGRKHERTLVLQPWQERIAYDLKPEFFLRGLIHSDGCRVMNPVTTYRSTGVRRYTYPRYFFTNESTDIRGFFIEACDRLGLECRYTKANTVSIARREQVALLDSFIGPKT
jgi:hypothetical protein